jgi:hypothetical protein
MAKAPRTLRQHRGGAPAYTLVDLTELDPELRKDIILDASEGGGIYGVRVVEESVNGAARAPIYGVYNDGPDADRWTSAKDKLGISGEQVDDSTVYAGAGVEVTDPRREAALREAAAQAANADADAIRAGERDAVAAITGDDDTDAAARRGRPTGNVPDLDHPANIIDPSALRAENEVSNVPADANAAPAQKGRPNKAPK